MKKYHLWKGFIVVLLIWFGLHYVVDSRLVPHPVTTFVRLFQDMISGELLVHGAFSLYRLGVAVCVALIMGVAVGVWMGVNEKAEALLAPFVYVMFPVPKAALLPIIFVFFGLGDGSKIILIYLILFFQITLAVYDATKDISSDMLVSAKTLMLNKKQMYRHVILPAILPNVLNALRTSVGIGIAVLFFAETYATSKGLGYYIMSRWSLLDYEGMYGGILLLGSMGYVIFRVIDGIKAKVVHWG